jgi:hypothetical protein
VVRPLAEVVQVSPGLIARFSARSERPFRAYLSDLAREMGICVCPFMSIPKIGYYLSLVLDLLIPYNYISSQ